MAELMPAELLALLEAARRYPDDDLTRLALADWLEENAVDAAQRDQASFIRLQLRLASLAHDDPERPALQAETDALKEQYREPWVNRAFPQVPDALSTIKRIVYWHRGMLWATIQRWEPDLGRLEAVGPSPWWEGLRSNGWSPMDEHSGPKKLRSPYLASFTALDLTYNSLKCAGVETLVSSPHLANLRSLELARSSIEAAGVEALAASPYLGNLTSLDLHGNPIDNMGALALANSRRLGSLVSLNLGSCALTEKGAEALAYSRRLANLARLDLSGNRINQKARTRLQQARPDLTICF